LKKIKTEIELSMIGLTKTDRTLTSRFAFPPDFIGFQGHFPAKKILPGVCQVQCALSTLEKGNEKALALKEIVFAKYFAPVFPGEEVTCIIRDVTDASGEIIFKAIIMKGTAKVAELKLRVSMNGGGNPRTA